MKVEAEVEETEVYGEYTMVEGVCVSCSRCGFETEAYGTSGASIRRCLAALREGCPLGESNFYTAEGDDEP